MSEPITRSDAYLAALSGETVEPPAPITRVEMYLAYLNGMTDTYPDPITRTEQYLYALCQNGMGGGGGSGVTIRNQNKTFTKNGSYKADSGYTGLGTVTVNVPQEEPVLQDKTATQNGQYTADEGFDGLGTVTVEVPKQDPVVQPLEVTENGTYNPPEGVDGFSPVTVNVAGAGGGEDLTRGLLEGGLTEIVDTKITSIRQDGLRTYPTLQRIEFTKVKTIYGYAIRDNKALTSVRFPALTTLSSSDQFTNCPSLIDVYMPLVEALSNFCFFNCSKLPSIILPKVNKLNSSCFSGCRALNTVVLKNDSVCALGSVDAFANTPFASGGTGGTVYVPAALISAYQTATNWSTLYAAGTCNFVAIEGSEYE